MHDSVQGMEIHCFIRRVVEPALHGEYLALGPAFGHGMSHNTVGLQAGGWSAGASAALFTHKSVSLAIWKIA